MSYRARLAIAGGPAGSDLLPPAFFPATFTTAEFHATCQQIRIQIVVGIIIFSSRYEGMRGPVEKFKFGFRGNYDMEWRALTSP